MDREAFFWQVADGRLPPPRVAATLGMNIVKVDAEAGIVEAEFEMGAGEDDDPIG